METVIATFDVVSLYTNIPHTFGLEAFRHFLLKYKEDIHPRFNIPFILGSTDFILKNNSCVFDNEYLLHLQGTAMGTVFAPIYTNLSMGYHEIKLFMILLNLITTLTSANTLWITGKDFQMTVKYRSYKTEDLLTILNSINNAIQFSMELNDNKLPFLDIIITKSGKKNWINIY